MSWSDINALARLSDEILNFHGIIQERGLIGDFVVFDDASFETATTTYILSVVSLFNAVRGRRTHA